MVIGYNKNAIVTPYDYSDCASFMEAAVTVYQECKIDKNDLYLSINEAVDLKAAKDKIVLFIRKWLSKILGLINKVKRVILERLAKKKSLENNENKSDDKPRFSIEDYDYSKITEDALKSFHLIGSDSSFPKSSYSKEYENYIQNRIKEWTGKDDQMDCISSDIKTYILDKYCGGKKITITDKTPGYDYVKDSDITKLNTFLKELERVAKNIARSLEVTIEDGKEYGFDDDMTPEEVAAVNKRIAGYVAACTKYTSLNTTLISALGDIVIGKATLYNKIPN